MRENKLTAYSASHDTHRVDAVNLVPARLVQHCGRVAASLGACDMVRVILGAVSRWCDARALVVERQPIACRSRRLP